MSDAESGPEEAPVAAGSRLASAIVVVIVIALVCLAVFGATALYRKGKSDGACDKEAQAVMNGYQAYLTSHDIGYKAEFERGEECTDVFVTLTKVTKGDGHTVTITCPQVKVKAVDDDHPLPYTEPVECDVVDTSTVKVGVGQPVKSG